MLYRNFASQAELDEQYNPGIRLADPQGFVQRRRELAARIAGELSGHYDIHYGPTLKERLDIYPAAQANAPVLIFFHGGYWQNPNLLKGLYNWIAKGLLPHGVTTVIADYEVCPKVTIDEIVRQCRAATAWTHRNIAGFGGDPSRLYVLGNSAGGHITAMIAETHWARDYGLPDDTMKGGCPVSGLYDLDPFPYTWLQPRIQLDWAQVRRNSPMRHIRAGLPPLLISHGGLESTEFYRQSDDFHAAWVAAGNRGTVLVQPGADHNAAIDGLIDPASPFCRAVIEHMASCWTPR